MDDGKAACLVEKRDETRAGQTAAVTACRTVAAMAVGTAGRTVAVKGCRWAERTGDERVDSMVALLELS